MADNTTLNAGTGGDVIASDDIGGVKHQRVKLSLGADGTAADAPVGGGVEAGVLRVTIASDSTGVLSVDDNGGALTVDNAGTFAVQATLAAETTKVIGTVNIAAAQTVATVTTVGAVTAITNALPAGTNNIGDVDVLSVVPGTGATALGKAEDAAHSSGDTGVMSLAVRRDADTALAGTDGDYAPLQVNAAGSLKVAITAGAGSGGTSIADGASFTRDTTSITPVGAVVETSAPTLTNGDAAGLSMTTGGAVRVAVASGGITGAVVDAVAGATDEGVLAVVVRDDALATLTPADADYTQMRTNARGALWVALDSTAAQTVTLAAGTATNEVVGDAAHDAAAAGNPLLCGAYASAAAPTDVSADADAVRLWALRSGALATQPTYGGVLAVAGNGAAGTGVQRVTLANDSTGVLATVTNVATIGTSVTPGTSAAHLGKAEDAAHSSGDTGVMSLGVRSDTAAAASGTTGDYEPFHTDSVGAMWTRSTGELADDAAFTPATSRVMPVGYLADETATDSVDEGDAGAARITLDRKQIVTLQPHTQGGLSIFRSLDIDETEEDVKTSAGQLYFIHAMNMVATARYLKFYNATAANVTVGSTTPVLTFPIPANSTTGAGFTVSIPQGLAFGTAISVACTTGIADADTGAPGANDVIINLGYM